MSDDLPESSKREMLLFGGIILTIVFALLLLWRSQNDPRVAELNHMLSTDSEISSFSYPFRVFSVKENTAFVSTPRSPEMSVLRFLEIDQPQLDISNPDSPKVIAAQKALASVQSKVHKLILSHTKIDKVEWQLDKLWYLEHGIDVQ